MNPGIASLASLPRGKPYQSRLKVYEEKICAWRAAKISYRQIAAMLAKDGLLISHSAVQDFVRVRDERNKRQIYCMSAVKVEPRGIPDEPDTQADSPAQTAAKGLRADERTTRKKHIYVPQEASKTTFTDADLAFNDPTNLT